MFKRVLAATVLLLSLTPFASNASLVNTDAFESGDGLAALDTETGRVWLDLSLTAGKTSSEISAMFDGEFKGWRFPTHQELLTFARNSFETIKSSGTSVFTGSRFVTPDERVAFTESIGYSLDEYSYGLYFDDNATTKLFGIGRNGLFFNYNRPEGYSSDGYYLIRDLNGSGNLADVPSPLSFGALFTASLLGFRKYHRKNKQSAL